MRGWTGAQACVWQESSLKLSRDSAVFARRSLDWTSFRRAQWQIAARWALLPSATKAASLRRERQDGCKKTIKAEHT
jgi:hypothetical protein